MLPVAAQVAGLDPESASAAADELVARGTLRKARPLAVERVAEIARVSDSLSASERASLHRRAATALMEVHAPHSVVADHLLASDPSGDPEAAIVLRDAAYEALSREHSDRAIAWLDRALLEPPEPSELAGVLLALGRAELVAGHLAEAADHLRRAIDVAGDDEVRARAARALARALVRSNEPASAVTVLEQAIEALGPEARDLALGLEVELASLAPTTVWVFNRVRERMELSNWKLTGATANEQALAAAAAELQVMTRGTAAEAAALSERGLTAGTHQRESTRSLAPMRSVWILLVAEHFDAAAGHIEHTLITHHGADDVVHDVALAFRAYLRLQTGALSSAAVDAREAVDRAQERRWRVPHIWATAVLVDTLIELGRVDEAKGALDGLAPADETAPLMIATAVLITRGTLHLAQDRQAQGISDLLDAGHQMHRIGVAAAGAGAWLPRLVPALISAGRVDEARALAEENLVLAERWGAPAALAASIGAHALTLPDEQASPRVKRALEVLGGSPVPLVRCRLQLQLARNLLRLGDRDRAGSLVEAAASAAATAGAVRLGAEAAALSDELSARPSGAGSRGLAALSTRELEVVRLVAQGKTNQQIAEELVISSRTVDTHVAKALRKTGTKRRTELAALAIHEGIDTPSRS